MSWHFSGFFVFVVFTNTWAKNSSTNKSDDTAKTVNRCGTCKVMEAQVCKPAAAPCPVTSNRVYKTTDDSTVNEDDLKLTLSSIAPETTAAVVAQIAPWNITFA